MRILLALAAGLIVSACAGGIQPPPPAPGHVQLFVATANQIAVIDSTTHQTVRDLPLGVPSADWKHLYSINGTALVDTDPLSGVTNHSVAIPGGYQLPAATSTGLPGGISPNSAWLVVGSYDGAPGATPKATHFLIVNTVESRVAHAINLSGYFLFDAISNDGQRLYLIQYLNGREYYVRLFQVFADVLDTNIVVDKSNGEQSMSGTRLSGIATPGGDWLFSMYVRESDGPFIHVLSLDGPFAFCLDLPGSGYASDAAERHWSVAMNPRGDTIYAVNGATGVVAEVDASQQYNPHVTRTAHINGGPPSRIGSNAAVLDANGSAIIAAGSSGLVWIDTRTLGVRARLLSDWDIWSVLLSADGKSLYAISDSAQIAEISISALRVVTTFDPALGRPIALMRVASA